MKGDLTLLLEKVEKKVGKTIELTSDFEKLAAVFLKDHIHLNATGLRRAWEHLRGTGKLSKDTLDKIALFVGYQSWADFQGALHEEDNGQTNYETEEN